MSARQRPDGGWPGLLTTGSPPPTWLPPGGIPRVLELRRAGLTWPALAERFGTTMNAVKAAARRWENRR